MAHFGLSHPREIYVHISKSLVPKALIFLPFFQAPWIGAFWQLASPKFHCNWNPRV